MKMTFSWTPELVRFRRCGAMTLQLCLPNDHLDRFHRFIEMDQVVQHRDQRQQVNHRYYGDIDSTMAVAGLRLADRTVLGIMPPVVVPET